MGLGLGIKYTASAALLFLISGFAALVYQVIWQRMLGIFSGVHIYSITIIVAAFMAGLGLGSLVGGRIADRLSHRKAVIGFGLCELVIGVFGFVSPWLYYDIAYHRLGFLVNYPVLLPVLHFSLLLVPTFFMGASLPLLAKGLVEGTGNAARTISLLYGVNTLGAALGAFTSVWWLIGLYGFEGTIHRAAILNLTACAGALLLQLRLRGEDPEPQEPAEQEVPPQTASAPSAPAKQPLGVSSWAAIYGLGGFIALSLELLWFRILDVAIKSSPYTFGHLLGVFLLFLALGGLAGAWHVRRSKHHEATFLWGQWAISITAAISVVTLMHLPADTAFLQELLEYWRADHVIEPHELAGAFLQFLGGSFPDLMRLVLKVYVVVPLCLLAVPTFLMGFTYAYIQRAVQTDLEEVGWRVGLIQFANIAGSTLGSLLTGTLFLAVLGTPATLRLLVVVGAAFGWLAATRTSQRPYSTRLAAVAVSLGLAAAIPTGDRFWARLHGSHVGDLVISEDASSVVVLQTLSETRAVMRVNGTGHSILPYGGVHTVLGAIPALLHEAPKDVLIIGQGTGDTAWAAASAPEVERVDLYEIAKPEYDVLVRYLEKHPLYPAADRFVKDPRIRFAFEDGRLALRLGGNHYDLIEADALEPHMAYSGNLYSREFFEEVRAALKPGGIFCTYAPSTRVHRTMVDVFSHVLDLHHAGAADFMIGSNRPLKFDRQYLAERLANPDVQAYFRTAQRGGWILSYLGRFVQEVQVERIWPVDRADYSDTELNTDLFPRDEYDFWTAAPRPPAAQP